MKWAHMTDEKPIESRANIRKPVGWIGRHFLVLLLAAAGAYILLESRAEWSPMHRWNRALGDAGLILISLSMAIGPLARLWPRCRRFMPFRREFGIHGVLLSVAHTVIILGGGWNGI
jgi:sulfoxide reductase heme-binding subunit YedZ